MDVKMTIEPVPVERTVHHPFTIEREGDYYVCSFPNLPGCMTHSASLLELASFIPEVYWLWRDSADESGYRYHTPDHLTSPAGQVAADGEGE